MTIVKKAMKTIFFTGIKWLKIMIVGTKTMKW